jgi:predicted phage terminase large subunit-like protein
MSFLHSSHQKLYKQQESLHAVISGGRKNRTATNQTGTAKPKAENWKHWLARLYPEYVNKPFAERHEELWNWVEHLQPNEGSKPFIALWPRGGAKSTSAELACVRIGCLRTRKYIWYISSTQDKADKHVETIASLLESSTLEREDTELAARKLGKYGSSKGWRRSRLRTASGLTIDALGLDVGSRGAKVENQRPDLMIFDDVDEKTDSEETTRKKIDVITTSLLPAGSSDLAVLFIQNLIHPNSIASRIVDGRADFLADRQVSGPHPAIVGLTYEKREGRTIITGGEETWGGQSIEICQRQIDLWGIQAFLLEAQHLVQYAHDPIFLLEWWNQRARFEIDDSKLRNLVVGRWLFYDTALKDKEANDYTACCVIELLPDYRVVIRLVWKRKMIFPELVKTIQDQARQWNYDEKLRGVIIEDKSSGTSAIQTLQTGADTWLAGIVKAYMPNGSKEERARLASVWCDRECVMLPLPGNGAPWLYDFEQSLEGFPNLDHDDDVDSFVEGILYLENLLAAGWQARNKGQA